VETPCATRHLGMIPPRSSGGEEKKKKKGKGRKGGGQRKETGVGVSRIRGVVMSPQNCEKKKKRVDPGPVAPSSRAPLREKKKKGEEKVRNLVRAPRLICFERHNSKKKKGKKKKGGKEGESRRRF